MSDGEDGGVDLLALKQQGNDAFRAKEYDTAIGHYTTAIESLEEQELDALSDENRELLGALYSNKCACLMFLDNNVDALVCADACIRARPTWKKGYCRRITILSKDKEQAARSVVELLTFLDKFGNPPVPEGEDEPPAAFTAQEQRWIETTQIELKFFCWSPVIRQMFPGYGDRMSEDDTKPPVVVVDTKGRGHFTSLFQATGTVPNGATVLVANGTYNDVIYLADKVDIEVVGQLPAWKTIVELKSRLEGPENADKVDSAVLVATAKARLRNLLIRCKLPTGEMVSAANLAEASVGFSNCIFECPRGVGIFAHHNSSIILSKCRLRDSKWGFLNMGRGCKLTLRNKCIVSMCEMGLCGREDIVMTLQDSEFRDCKDQGVIVMGKPDAMATVEVTGCQIKGCASKPDSKSGCLVAGAVSCIFRKCEFLSNGFQSLHLKGTNGVISECEFCFSQMGVALQCRSPCVLRENVFRNVGFAIWLTENEDSKVTVERNTFEKCTLAISKYPGERDPTLVDQPDIDIVEYSNVVSGAPRRTGRQ